MTPRTYREQVLAAYERAKADVLKALDEYPCAGQVYTYTRGPRTYVKWQSCHHGTRCQRAFPLAALEELTAGVQAHEPLQTALQQLYAAAQAVHVQRISEGTVGAPSKKTLATAEEELCYDAMTRAARHVVFLGDGAKANWNVAETLFLGRVQILDFYPAMEHLAVSKNSVMFPTPAVAEKWYATTCRALQRGRWPTVMKLISTRPALAHAHAVLARERAHFKHNQHRMRYGEFQARGYYSGSGVVESSCTQIVSERIREPGARWQPLRCQAMLNLRCAYMSQLHNRASPA